MLVVPLIDDEVLKRRQQEGTEPAAPGIGLVEEPLFQEARKVTLSEILSVLHGVAAPSHVAIERLPVGAAQLRERGRAPAEESPRAASTRLHCVLAKRMAHNPSLRAPAARGYCRGSIDWRGACGFANGESRLSHLPEV